MALLNEKQGWLFLLNPRTASRATRRCLIEKVPFTVELSGGYHADVSRIKLPNSVNLSNYQIFQTVRHPCDVLSTEYHRGVPHKTYPTLLDWLQSIRNDTLQGLYPCQKNSRLRTPAHLFMDATFNFRYERLQYQFDLTWPGVTLELDPAHVTAGKPNWEDEWGAAEREWARKYLQDLDRYGYSV